MKSTSKKIAALTASALSLLLTNKVAGDEQQRSTDPQPSTSITETSKTMDEMPARCNKASGIIGMEVRNQIGDQLGHVKDVVFDLKNEKVSYVVMSTSPKALLGINEKLLAVPLTALTTSADEKHLILNADKAKVEAAEGFDHKHWPSVNSPSWGAEPFWQSTTTPPDTSGRTTTPPPARPNDK